MDDDCDFEGSFHYKDGFLVRADSVGAPAAPADRAELAELSESERERLRDLLGQERAVSARRRALHARLDFIRSQGDTGNAETANQIEYLTAKERSLSDLRGELHREIDRLQGIGSRSRRDA